MNFPPSTINPFFRVTTRVVTGPIGTVIQFVPPSPNRVSLLLWPQPGSTYTYGPSNIVTSSTGFQMATTTVPLWHTYKDAGPVVGGAWFAINGLLAFSAAYTEVVFEPPGGA